MRLEFRAAERQLLQPRFGCGNLCLRLRKPGPKRLHLRLRCRMICLQRRGVEHRQCAQCRGGMLCRRFGLRQTSPQARFRQTSFFGIGFQTEAFTARQAQNRLQMRTCLIFA